jgi:soluble lytic murein transglycosylase-like protein
MRRLCAPLLLVAFVGGCTSSDSAPSRPGPAQAEEPAAAPAPNSPLPRSAGRFAVRLTEVSRELRGAIDEWLAGSPGARDVPPRELQLLALYQQRSYRRLARGRKFQRAVLPRLPGWLRGEARAMSNALHGLFRLSPPARSIRRFKTGRALPPGTLLRFYRKGERRFDVQWQVLAAVNLVETVYNRLRNTSTAGAQGPMQFIPSTWRAYGMGGDIHDPHDAVLGAANYLHASGAPGSYSRALYAYNHSTLYVRAVLRFARRMRADSRTYYALWSWQVFVRTRERGDVRLTTP